MRISLENIGPIKQANLELGRLTIIAGRNNTGKTYIAYTLYGFLKNWRANVSPVRFTRRRYGRRSESGANPPSSIDAQAIATALLTEGEASFPIEQERLAHDRQLVLNQLTEIFSESDVADVFSAPWSDFDGTRLAIEADTPTSFSPRKHVFGFADEEAFSIDYDGKNMNVTGHVTAPPDRIDIQRRRLSRFLEVQYVHFLLSDLPRPFTLSAERFGISLFYRELDFTKNRLVEIIQNAKEQRELDPFLLVDKMASRYPLPVKDNIDYTRNIPNGLRLESAIHNKKLFDDVKDIVGGHYTASDDERRFVSHVRSKRTKKDGFSIPMHLASSSARGMSDLYFFLRHEASRDHLLIVDEPESHLDTTNQIALARLMARILDTGVRVLVTTHSDYFVKEINNLIMLDQIPKTAGVVGHMGYTGEKPIKTDFVRAYVAENGSLSPCTIDKLGIDMPVFDTTIHEINRVSSYFAGYLDNEED